MTACGCAGVSVCSPRMKHSLSTCRAVCGKRLETQVPVRPWRAKWNLDAVKVAPPGATRPSCRCKVGLYSNVSICDMAPSMNRKMMRLALARKCGARGASGPAPQRQYSDQAYRREPDSRNRRRRIEGPGGE